jgi:hypothetical protein
MNEALGADRGHNCLGESDGFVRRFRLHCNKRSARGNHCKLTDLRVAGREPINEFLGRGLRRRIILLPGVVRCGLGHLAVHFSFDAPFILRAAAAIPESIVVNFYGFVALCSGADLQFPLSAPYGSLDALDQVVDFKWLPEQARCTRGRGLSLEVRV